MPVSIQNPKPSKLALSWRCVWLRNPPRHPPSHMLTLKRSPQNPDSESARKKSEAERLRAAEKFMVIGSGEAQCKGCGYEYKPGQGDPEFPIAKGTLFQVRVAHAHPL